MPMDEMDETPMKRKPVMKRKGGPTVVIAIGAPKSAKGKPPMEDEASSDDASEDAAEYGSEDMCECPECGHKFKASEHMAEDDGED